MSNGYTYLFGPVPSRRFGRSLGVDLTPFKTCSLDCVFCQLGRTTHRTVERAEYVPIAEVLAELGRWLAEDGAADYVTLSGSGEPTLHSRFGEVLDLVHARSSIPAVVLTNGTLLSLPAVREAASRADVVKVSLSAWDQASFRAVNRPHPSLDFERLLDGYRDFRAQFAGKLWLEVFVVRGINSVPADMSRIAVLAETVRPDRVQLNTAVRPPAEEFVAPVPADVLAELARLFTPDAEVIAEFSTTQARDVQANEKTILAMLQRRPCTAEDVASVFGMHMNEVSKYIGKLVRTERIQGESRDGTVYYAAGPGVRAAGERETQELRT